MSLLVKDGNVYKYQNLIVAPWPIEDILAASYLKFKEQDLLQAFFHEDYPEPRSVRDWLDWSVLDKGSYLLGAYVREANGGLTTTGIGKVGRPVTLGSGHKKAELSMMFFREYQTRSITLTSCQMMLENIFDCTDLDTLFGTIPEHNHASSQFMRAIGFNCLGQIIPHYCSWHGEECGAWVGWMSEDHWRTISPFNVLPEPAS